MSKERITMLYTPFWRSARTAWRGLQEMRDAEKPSGRFAFKEYISEPARELLAELAAKAKEKKDAAMQVLWQEAYVSPPQPRLTERGVR